MAYVCEHGDLDLSTAPVVREKSAGPRHAVARFAEVAHGALARIWAWGEPDADAAIIRALQRSGGRLTDSIEREALQSQRYGDWRVARRY